MLHGSAFVDPAGGPHLCRRRDDLLPECLGQRAGLGRPLEPRLLERAKCARYELACTVDGDTFHHHENTVMDRAALGGKSMDHTDENTLKRV